MAIKTTRIKAPQAPELRTYNISDQVDGTKTTFTLPFTVNNQQNIDYLLFDGKMLRNDSHRTYYTISHDGTTLTTKFTAPVGSVLQFVSTDNSAGAESATKRDVEEAKEAAVEESKEYTDEKVSAEAEARETKDEELSAAISVEETERAEADAALSTRIDDNDEAISNLEGSVSELDNKITEEANTRAEQDGILGQSITDETAAREAADIAIEGKLDKSVVTDIALDSTASTTVVKLNETKTNLKTGVITPEEVVFPIADSENAGIMNAATFKSISNNSNNIENLMNGAVMTTLLTAEPTQQQILTAWQMASGETEPLNSASVWDSINHKKYTYFSAQRQWIKTQEGLGGEGVTVNPWTNESAGIVKGSTNAGQIFAESDGTGSVNGWDDLRSDATVALEKATINAETIETKQDELTAGVGIKIENNVISNTQTSAEWGNITGTLSSQTDLKTELDKKIEAKDPSSTEEIESVVTTSMIKNKSITSDKLADGVADSIKQIPIFTASYVQDSPTDEKYVLQLDSFDLRTAKSNSTFIVQAYCSIQPSVLQKDWGVCLTDTYTGDKYDLYIPSGATAYPDYNPLKFGMIYRDNDDITLEIRKDDYGNFVVTSMPYIPDAYIKSHNIDWTTIGLGYSLSEQKTSATWIDGKPIYKLTKVFSCNGQQFQGLQMVVITGSLVDYELVVENVGSNWAASVKSNGYTGDIGLGTWIYRKNTGVLEFQNKLQLTTSDKIYATVYYTK